MKAAREVKIGALMILTLVLLYWGVNYLKGRAVFSRQISFFVVYPETGGLIESHPVSLNGMQIGQVRRMFFHPDQSGQIVVECVIGRQIGIPVNSVAVLATSGLMGNREISLQRGNASQLIQTGDTLPGIVQPGIEQEITRQIMPVKQQIEFLFYRIDTLVGTLNQAVSPGTIDQVQQSLISLNSGMQHIESVAANLRRQNEAISQIIKNTATFSDSLAVQDIGAVFRHLDQSLLSLQEMFAQIESGEGNLGRLLYDEQLYKNLQNASFELDSLLEDIRLNPRRYVHFSVFGRSR